MEGKVLVAYASKHGSTLEVAAEIEKGLRKAGLATALREVARVERLADYEAVVLGAPIYMGRWHRDAHRFLRKYDEELEGKPLAVFALGPLHEDETEWTKAREVLATALDGRSVTPVAVEVFGGRIDPEDLRFPFSRMSQEDARDWTAIAGWAAELPRLLRPVVPV